MLRVLKVEGSTSKAENLNEAMEHVKTSRLVIYDADHHPDSLSLLGLTAHLDLHPDCGCVAGSTYVRHARHCARSLAG